MKRSDITTNLGYEPSAVKHELWCATTPRPMDRFRSNEEISKIAALKCDCGAEPEPRDYLKEAYAIVEGRTLLLPEKDHILALIELVNAYRAVFGLNRVEP